MDFRASRACVGPSRALPPCRGRIPVSRLMTILPVAVTLLVALIGAGVLLVLPRQRRGSELWALLAVAALVAGALTFVVPMLRHQQSAPTFILPLRETPPPEKMVKAPDSPGTALVNPVVDPAIDARFQESAEDVERAISAIVDDVDRGMIGASTGEGQLDALKRRLQVSWEVSEQNPPTHQRYLAAYNRLTESPKENADIFAYRRIEDGLARLRVPNSSLERTIYLQNLRSIKALIDIFAAVVEQMRGDARKATRLSKAVDRLSSLKSRYADIASAAPASQNTLKNVPQSVPGRTATAAPAPPVARPPVQSLPTGHKAMGDAVLCPYRCTREYLHYDVGGRDTPSGAVVTCRVCGRQFRVP